jgi:hypothetical protein
MDTGEPYYGYDEPEWFRQELRDRHPKKLKSTVPRKERKRLRCLKTKIKKK